MKKYWQTLSARIDARTLRERTMLFAMAAAFLIFLMFFFVLNPSYARQKIMLDDMAHQQEKINAVDLEITHTIEASSVDPDAAERARLNKVQDQAKALRANLTAMQAGMVPAERMSFMLEQILRAHRGLHLKSMRTLADSEADPVAPLVAGGAPAVAVANPAGAAAHAEAAPAKLLHRHGVELVVQGSYPDMVAYMAALEGMQGQIFWDRADMAVETYPTATLTLTLYTINLDQKWLKL
jgi:MSHA biogenesis protein MshJ